MANNQPQPSMLFVVLDESEAIQVQKHGLGTGVMCHKTPPKRWPLHKVGAVIRLDQSHAWAKKVNSHVWALQGQVHPDHISLYVQEK